MTDSDDISSPTLGKNRHLRALLHHHAILSKKWSEEDLQARREYWYKQMYFLVCLLKSMYPQSKMTIDELNDHIEIFIKERNELDFLIDNIIDKNYSSNKKPVEPKDQTWQEMGDEIIMNWLPKNHEYRKKIKALQDDEKEIFLETEHFIPEEKYPLPHENNVLINGDVIEVITTILQKGFIPVVNNAANSNRDGSAKYSKGSLEEEIARHTSSMFDMLCHFKEKNKKQYQRRYLRACLVMIKKILNALNPDTYINSTTFLEDFLSQTGMEQKEKKAEPIHFDIQNKAYEVLPEKGNYSHLLFHHTKLKTFFDFKNEIKEDKFDRMIVVIQGAAPDLRIFEGMPDKLCSRDPILRHPENYHTYDKMVKVGVNLQCDQAIIESKRGKKPYIIFVLPGCGAFGNPVHPSVEIFLTLINKRKNELDECNIPFCIVEKNPKTFEVINNYLNPPPKVSCNWKVILAGFTSFLIVPLLYVALFQHHKNVNRRYHDVYREQNFFQLKNAFRGGASSVTFNKPSWMPAKNMLA